MSEERPSPACRQRELRMHVVTVPRNTNCSHVLIDMLKLIDSLLGWAVC